MSEDLLLDLAGHFEGLTSDQIAALEGIIPDIRQLISLVTEAQPLIAQALPLINKALPLVQQAQPLIAKVAPVLGATLDAIEKRKTEALTNG